MDNNLPQLTPEEQTFVQWLDTPEHCSRLYPSVCNGKAISRIKLGDDWHPLCKMCMQAMKKQLDRIFE